MSAGGPGGGEDGPGGCALGWSGPRCSPRSRSGEAVLRARAEAAGYRRLLRARAAEVEALRGAVGALHRQLEGLRDRRSGELAKYQVTGGGRAGGARGSGREVRAWGWCAMGVERGGPGGGGGLRGRGVDAWVRRG